MMEEKILFALERIHTATRAALQQAVTERGLSPLQAQILHFTARRESATVSQLASQLRVSKPTISDAVAVLLKKNLVEKVAGQADARTHSLILTTAGAAEAVQIARHTDPFLGAIDALAPPQREALWEALLNLIRTMEGQGLLPPQRMCFSCRHFARDVDGAPYYCLLMDAPLRIQDIRVDCGEHDRAVPPPAS